MSKVVSLKGTEIVAPGTPNPDVITELEKLVEMAKAGEIEGIAYAVLFHDDLTTYNRKGRLTRGVIGCLELMKTAICIDDLESK